MKKTTIIKILIMYAVAVLCAMCARAQDCACKQAEFSCYPDCDFAAIKTIEIPVSSNYLVNIKPKPGEAMDIRLYFGTDSLTVINVDVAEFTAKVCMLYFNSRKLKYEDYTGLKVINHKHGQYPGIDRQMPLQVAKPMTKE